MLFRSEAAAAGCGLAADARGARSEFTRILREFHEWWKRPETEAADGVDSLAAVLAQVGKHWQGNIERNRAFAQNLMALLGADGRMTRSEWELLPWILATVRITPAEFRKALEA